MSSMQPFGSSLLCSEPYPTARASSLASTSKQQVGSSPVVKEQTRAPTRPSLASYRGLSSQSIRLDLEGLDLGGTVSILDEQSDDLAPEEVPMNRHMRSKSSNSIRPLTINHSKSSPTDLFSSAKHVSSQAALNEDSFSAHLREECTDYREIMTSQVAINGIRSSNEKQRSAGIYARRPSYGQVLGGFASLGLQSATEPQAVPPRPKRQVPIRTLTTHSTDSSDMPHTPRDMQDSFDSALSDDYDVPAKWSHLCGRPCNPLEPLDILSIEEMGLQGIDIGSLNDWEGTKLSAELLCPINGHLTVEWAVAHSNRRTKKWVVVPSSTIVCGTSEGLSTAARAERTVVVGERSLWSDTKQSTIRASGAKAAFSGRAGFEIRILRAEPGRINAPIYLANADTHRLLHNFRMGIDAPLTTACGSVIDPADLILSSQNASQQAVYPVLRRSRSRPYLRPEHAPMRRSRSKPYLRYSAAQQQHQTIIGDDFAPSLPGNDVARFQPGENWPSARSNNTDSIDSSGTASSSDMDSDASSHGLAIVISRGSTVESTSAASSDPSSTRPNVRLSPRTVRPAVADNMPSHLQTSSESSTATLSTVASSAGNKAGKAKGLTRALMKKDKVLGGWFKKKQVATSLPPFAGTPSISQLVYSPPILAPLPADEKVALTEDALGQLQSTMPPPCSPESTVVGSRRGSEALTHRRGSEALTQKAYPSGRTSTLDDLAIDLANEKENGPSMTDSRNAINSTLAQIYGWNEETMADKTLSKHSMDGLRRAWNPARDTLFQNLDEENALLGLDAVPADALTMLIPLPLIGRVRSEEAVRYLRLNFIPFREAEESSTPSSEAADDCNGSQLDLSTLDNGHTSKTTEWKRKLGGAFRQQTQAKTGRSRNDYASSAVPPPPLRGCKDAFRVTALILAPPSTPASTAVDPRIAHMRTFPVVLGYCNGDKAFDMVPEGWASMQLGGHVVPTKPDGSPLDGPDPQRAITDIIMAACAAVMDI